MPKTPFDNSAFSVEPDADAFRTLSGICLQVAGGDYTRAKLLFDMTVNGRHHPLVAELAEAFGLMLVKLEAREFELGRTIKELDEACKLLTEGQQLLTRENRKLKADLKNARRPDRLIGSGPAMKGVLRVAERAAKARATVLITGETGTGKGMLARHIHQAGPRSSGPFVAINCAAIPSSLLESELFGIEKGVASGVDARMGRFEQADGGTLFLDEIGDMPLESQAKILQVIEEGRVERIGARKPVAVDVRIIAATHRDLLAEAGQGRFRTDLYYRLNVIRLQLPALRERVEDIAPLASFFLQNAARRNGAPARVLHKNALRILQGYAWPGNVRQLENEMERAALLALKEVVLVSDLSATLLPPEQGVILSSLSRSAPPGLAVAGDSGKAGGGVSPMHDAAARERESGAMAREAALSMPEEGVPTIEAAEEALIRQALAQCGGNRTRAARMLDISREGLRKKMIRLGIRDA